MPHSLIRLSTYSARSLIYGFHFRCYLFDIPSIAVSKGLITPIPTWESLGGDLIFLQCSKPVICSCSLGLSLPSVLRMPPIGFAHLAGGTYMWHSTSRTFDPKEISCSWQPFVAYFTDFRFLAHSSVWSSPSARVTRCNRYRLLLLLIRLSNK